MSHPPGSWIWKTVSGLEAMKGIQAAKLGLCFGVQSPVSASFIVGS